MPDLTSPGTQPARGKMNNAFDPATATGLDEQTRTMVERRQRLLGPAYRLFYHQPVEFVRGRGVLLYDRDGRDYLDAYNNVVSVGHAHPRVTEAISAQLGTLCTHTRYLQPGILDYAEDLLGTHSGRIGASGQAMFTCTGSEANDLALRMARHHTGRRGIIVTAEAYHGNSDLVAGVSPSLGEGSPLDPWVRRGPGPGSYRGPRPRTPTGGPAPAWAPGWPARSRPRSTTWNAAVTGWPRSSPTPCSPPTASTPSPPTCSPRWPRCPGRREACSWPTRCRAASPGPGSGCGATSGTASTRTSSPWASRWATAPRWPASWPCPRWSPGSGATHAT